MQGAMLVERRKPSQQQPVIQLREQPIERIIQMQQKKVSERIKSLKYVR
jgi:hypothetical protein